MGILHKYNLRLAINNQSSTQITITGLIEKPLKVRVAIRNLVQSQELGNYLS